MTPPEFSRTGSPALPLPPEPRYLNEGFPPSRFDGVVLGLTIACLVLGCFLIGVVDGLKALQ